LIYFGREKRKIKVKKPQKNATEQEGQKGGAPHLKRVWISPSYAARLAVESLIITEASGEDADVEP